MLLLRNVWSPVLLTLLVVIKLPGLSAGPVTLLHTDLLARPALAHVKTQPRLVVLQLPGRTEAPPLVHVLAVAGGHLDLDLRVLASL